MDALCATILLAAGASPQNIITTFAGKDFVFDGDGKRATSAPLGGIVSVAVDRSGNVLLADATNRMIMRFALNGNLTVIGGNGGSGYTGDGGIATAASLGDIGGLAVDSSGNVYVSDPGDHVVLKISVEGVITTVAGGGAGGDGQPGTSARLNRPLGLAVDAAGNLYIADSSNHRIRRLSTAGVISTVAGNGNAGSQ